MIYLDTSAAIKLIAEEAESDALTGFIDNFGSGIVSSELIETEIARTALRISDIDPKGAKQMRKAWELLYPAVELIDLNRNILQAAARVPYTNLGTLDAIHIASALACSVPIEVLVTYDERQKKAGIVVGLKVESPR